MTASSSHPAADGLAQTLQALHLAGGKSSRAELTREVGRGRSAVGYLLGELTAKGLVTVERGAESAAGGGRPSQLVRVARTAPFGIGVQVSADSVAAAKVGIGGEVIGREERPLAANASIEEVRGLLGSLIAELATPRPRAIGAAVAVPSPVSRVDGRAVAPLHLGWSGLPLRELLSEELARRSLAELPLAIANDSNLAALAESRRGAGRGARQLLYLATAHLGLGGGLVTEGRLVEGSHGYAIEPGHVAVNSPGTPCVCGSTGCLEVEADNRALLRFHGDPDVPAERVLAASARVLDAAEAGDPTALRAVGEVAHHLGTGIASLVNLVDPDRVLLGETLARVWRLMPEEIASRVAARAYLDPLSVVPIGPAELADAPLLGAGEAALSPLLENPRAVL